MKISTERNFTFSFSGRNCSVLNQISKTINTAHVLLRLSKVYQGSCQNIGSIFDVYVKLYVNEVNNHFLIKISVQGNLLSDSEY